MCVCVSLCLFFYLSFSPPPPMYVYVCVCVCACLHARACLCACVYLRVWVYTFLIEEMRKIYCNACHTTLWVTVHEGQNDTLTCTLFPAHAEDVASRLIHELHLGFKSVKNVGRYTHLHEHVFIHLCVCADMYDLVCVCVRARERV